MVQVFHCTAYLYSVKNMHSKMFTSSRAVVALSNNSNNKDCAISGNVTTKMWKNKENNINVLYLSGLQEVAGGEKSLIANWSVCLFNSYLYDIR